MANHTDPKDNKILKLEKENERIKRELTKFAKDKYGLFWFDVPEGFDDDVENKLPILEEVPKLAINNKDGKPTHLLIEGDNYHALTCLNYTHKGKIDVKPLTKETYPNEIATVLEINANMFKVSLATIKPKTFFPNLEIVDFNSGR